MCTHFLSTINRTPSVYKRKRQRSAEISRHIAIYVCVLLIQKIVISPHHLRSFGGRVCRVEFVFCICIITTFRHLKRLMYVSVGSELSKVVNFWQK
jgi:hypothetical protein